MSIDRLLFLALGATIAAGAFWLLLVRARRQRVEQPAPVAEAPARESAGQLHRSALGCPSCRRRYPPGLRFCPHDSRALLPVGEVPVATAGVTCRSCRRSYDAGTRFCPFDGEELAPETPSAAAAAEDAVPGSTAKICPHCAHRYRAGEAFCGRDGNELVAVN